MAALSHYDLIRVSEMSGDIMTLLALDDAWTAAVASASFGVPHADEAGSEAAVRLGKVLAYQRIEAAIDLGREIMSRLSRINENQYPSLMSALPELLGPDGEEQFTALLWSDDLNPADRDDLRWIAQRHGGLAGLAGSAAAELDGWRPEYNAIQEQVNSLSRGLPASGDFSKHFRCGLGNGLMVSGFTTMAGTASLGAGAALAVGGTIAAGVAVAATGGIAGLAILVAGVVIARKAMC
jgi:hypothetical protein